MIIRIDLRNLRLGFAVRLAHNYSIMNKHRLEQIEKYVIGYFQARQHTRILAKELFDSTSTFANADIVRALEDLEKHERLLVRHTTEGNDYISLTPQGIELLGLQQAEVEDDVPALPHPPKSATKVV
jgi:hypothetical protein